jgi:hypothetical protein
MQLKGSCHCGAVSFSLESPHPYPYQRCYCSICRKTDGGGGYAINLSGDNGTLKVKGREHIRVYHAKIRNPEDKRAHTSNAERSFCGECGSGLWLYDSRWPELVHPFAAVIDTPLPVAPETTHLMLEFKPDWVQVEKGAKDQVFDRYPEESIADWHARLALADAK